MLKRIALVSVLATFASVPVWAEGAPQLPPTPKRPVVEEYQGVKVPDPYRWLEESSDPAVKKWTEEQNAYARWYLDRLPHLQEIKAQLQKWNEFQSPVYRELEYRKGVYFALKLQPPKNQPILVTLKSLDDLNGEHVLVDPNLLDSSGTTAIDFFEPSLDGTKVAVSLSKGGSEVGTLFIYDLRSGKKLPDEIPFVNKPTGGGSVAWNAEGMGLYYTRYPHSGERPEADLDFYQQIYFHKLGSPSKDDTYSVGKDFPRIAEIALSSAEDGSAVLATVANGDGGEFAHYVLRANGKNAGKWIQVTRFEDKATYGHLGLHGDLFLVSIQGTPRGKILKLSLDEPELTHARVIVPEGPGVIGRMVPTDGRLYVGELVGGPSEVHVFTQEGKSLGKIPTPALSDISGIRHTTADDVVYRVQSYVQPITWYEYERGKPHKTALVTQSPVSFADIEVKRESARSKDGTRVPLTVMYRKGTKRDGKNPTLLYGYGGYGISLSPYFTPDVHFWLQNGGVYAIANLRGGGEYGDAWHKGGNLTHKQNVFDDFIACAEHLVQRRYTNPKKLAIEGGSNGGLLMGAALTQRPELFRAVVSHVGIYDMLRVEHDPNGAFNVTEFGTVKDPEQFKALYGYSPYHHVVDGTRYPAILLMIGANDGRVSPYHSKKMAARLQAATASGEPVLLRVNFSGGHGIGRSISQKVAEEADSIAFLFQQLGMKDAVSAASGAQLWEHPHPKHYAGRSGASLRKFHCARAG